MTPPTTKPTGKDRTQTWNRWGYAMFLLLAFYYLVFQKDLGNAVATLGIALVFDPFDPAVKWQERMRWQKAWLLVHVSIVFLFLLLLVLRK